MYNIQNDFKKRIKLIISGSFLVEITLSWSHSGNSFELSHSLTGFLNYALFCLSFFLRLNLKQVNYLKTRRSSMDKRHGSILILFWQRQRPHKAIKQRNHTNIECSVYLMIKVCCLS